MNPFILELIMTRMVRTLAFLLVIVALAGCTSPTDPDDPGTSGGAAIAVSHVGELPRFGGDFRRIEPSADGGFYALAEGRILHYASPDAAPRTLGSGEEYLGMSIAPDGALWALTRSEIHVYAPGATSPRVVTVDAGSLGSASFAWLDGGVVLAHLAAYPTAILIRSSDGGATWSRVEGVTSYHGSLAVAPNGDVYLQGNPSFFVSTDRGLTWQARGSSVAGYSGRILVTRDGTIFNWLPMMGTLRVSRDAGRTFTELSPFNAPPIFGDIREGASGELWATIGMQPGAPAGVHRSTDGGATWSLVVPALVSNLVIDGSRFIAGSQYGLFYSEDAGATWHTEGTTVAERATDLAVDRNGRALIVVDGTLYRREASRWRVLVSQGRNPMNVAVNAAGEIALMSGFVMMRSSDDGATWRRSEITDYVSYSGSLVIPALAGRSVGDWLVSMASYENTKGIYAGALYRIDAAGTVRRLNEGGTFDLLVADRNSRIYGRTVFLNSLNYQTEYEIKWTVTAGEEWSTDPTRQTPSMLAFNSRNQYVRAATDGVIVGTVGLAEGAVRPVEAAGTALQRITSAAFDAEDRLYLLAEGQPYVSTGAVRHD